jgi:hypothetical protein
MTFVVLIMLHRVDIYVTVDYVKLCFLLHAHKFRVTGMHNEWKLISMHGNNKNLILNTAFPP